MYGELFIYTRFGTPHDPVHLYVYLPVQIGLQPVFEQALKVQFDGNGHHELRVGIDADGGVETGVAQPKGVQVDIHLSSFELKTRMVRVIIDYIGRHQGVVEVKMRYPEIFDPPELQGLIRMAAAQECYQK
jgi:hypothetical protein